MIRYLRDNKPLDSSLVALSLAFIVVAAMAIIIWQSGETARLRGVWPAAASPPPEAQVES